MWFVNGSPTERVAEGYRGGIYSDSFTQLTYHTLLGEAERSLKAGKVLSSMLPLKIVNIVAFFSLELPTSECPCFSSNVRPGKKRSFAVYSIGKRRVGRYPMLTSKSISASGMNLGR